MGVTDIYSTIVPICRKTRGGGHRGPNACPLISESTRLALCNQPSSGVYLNAKIGGSDVHLSLDTGAQAPIIPKHVWLWLKEGGCPLLDYVGEASAANGGTMYILGHWQTICQFGSLALINYF